MHSEPRDLFPPTDLPDLASLAAHSPKMAMRRMFMGGGATDHQAYVIQLNAVRLADCALAEYSLARQAIDAFHAEQQSVGLTYFHRASAHFENCVWAIERFIKHAKALRSAQFVPAGLSDLIPRQSTFLQSQVERKITRMRHSVAHLEGDALKGLLPPGSSVILLALKPGLSVGEHTISWTELLEWLRDINTSASALADYTPAVRASS